MLDKHREFSNPGVFRRLFGGGVKLRGYNEVHHVVLSAEESRKQVDQCIQPARTAGSASERKLYLRLAFRWLEIAISMESDTIELRATTDVAALMLRLNAP